MKWVCVTPSFGAVGTRELHSASITFTALGRVAVIVAGKNTAMAPCHAHKKPSPGHLPSQGCCRALCGYNGAVALLVGGFPVDENLVKYEGDQENDDYRTEACPEGAVFHRQV